MHNMKIDANPDWLISHKQMQWRSALRRGQIHHTLMQSIDLFKQNSNA